MIKSRIAPTPSGFLHRGNALNFLLTSMIVREQGGVLRLRIDDLDAPRVRPEYLDDIFETLHWLNIHWHEGPANTEDQVANYSQQLRIPIYQQLLDLLIANGQVFACNCSRKELSANSPDGKYPGTCRFKNTPLNTPDTSLRLITPKKSFIHFKDSFLGEVSINLHEQARDFIVRRRDGLPAYGIASLCDDVAFGINTIVRGEDLLLSTAVQLYLAELTSLPSFQAVQFYHHPLITHATGEKLSKSTGSTSMKSLRENGFTQQHFWDEFERWKKLLISRQYEQ